MSEIDKIKELFTNTGGLFYTAAVDSGPATLKDQSGKTIAISHNDPFWHVTGYASVIAYSVPDGSTDCLVFPHSDDVQYLDVIKDGIIGAAELKNTFSNFEFELGSGFSPVGAAELKNTFSNFEFELVSVAYPAGSHAPIATLVSEDEPEELNVVTSDDSDISVYTSLPGSSNILETESCYALADAAINEATSKLKAPLEDINTSETILEGILRILNEEVVETPQLRYFIQALEGEKDTILGEINAYRDAHARIMTNWWSTLIAADPSHSSLALRATFDMDTLGNLNESSYVSWWHDNVLPWLKQHGEFFNHEMVEAQTQAILSEVGMQQAQVATKH